MMKKMLKPDAFLKPLLAMVVSLVLLSAANVADALPLATAVSAGQSYSCAVVNGGVQCWGKNTDGQLGNSTTTDSLVPVQAIAAGSNVTAVAAGTSHSCAVVDGGVQCWGRNGEGQLGNNSIMQSPVPVMAIAAGSNVTAVSAGSNHSCAVVNGGVQCWGQNSFGQFGINSFTSSLVPVQSIAAGSNVTAVAAGFNHSCAVVNGGAQCWGNNPFGQLGNSGTVQSSVPVQTIAAGSNVTAVAASSNNHSCAVVNGGVRCWGRNDNGQIGDDSTTNRLVPEQTIAVGSNVTVVSAGNQHSCAVLNGGVQCWGFNINGQLGNGTTMQRLVPVQAIVAGSNVTAVSAGVTHSCAVVNGGVQCWGANSNGQLGNNSTTQSLVPVMTAAVPDAPTIGTATAGAASATLSFTPPNSDGGAPITSYTATSSPGGLTGSAAVSPITVSGLTVGTPYTFTVTASNAVGSGPASAASNSVTPLAGLSATAIAAGGFHTCALTSGGAVQCWGFNQQGQVGDNTTTPRPTPVAVSGLSSGVTAIAAGGQRTCALTSAGAVQCWGANFAGQLGDNTTTQRPAPVAALGLSAGVTAITAGGTHTCALTSAGAVRCWGQNLFGGLGDNTTTTRLASVAVAGLSSGIAAIAAGGSHTCALTSAGAVKCWGLNDAGQLGDNTTTNRLVPVAVPALIEGVAAIAAGGGHACALSSAGGVKCWGLNDNGQLGDNTTTNRLAPVAVLGLSSGVAAIAAGERHTCALTSAGAVKCWGLNDNGQLGDNSITRRLAPVAVSGLSSGVTAITAGDLHTCAVTSGGLARCWGRNNFYQLGDGSFTDRLTPVAVAVSALPGAPTIGTATAGNAQATVAFTAPGSDGGSAITSYLATSIPGGVTATCVAPCSNITVLGLTNGTSYTFIVAAINSNGTGPGSAPSNGVTAGSVAPTITSTAPANGITGSAYSHTFTATGTTPITWSITSGTAPTGLALNASSGVLAGTPTTTGTFGATITATNAGGTGTQGVSITVTAAAQPFAYISNQSNNNVSVINTATNTLVVSVPVGNNPTGVAVHPGSARVYVANENSATVSVIDTATNTVVAVVPVGSFPRGVAVLPDGSRVYVANINGNNVSVINTATNTVVGTVSVGSSPAGIAVHPDGSRVYVTNTSSNSVSVINTATNTVLATVSVGSEPHGVVVHTDGSRVYVTNRGGASISVINTATNTVLATVGVGTTPNGVAVHPDGSRVYVANTFSGSVSVINTATNVVTATVAVGSAPFGVAVHPDGARVYVANNVTNNVSVISTASNTVATTFAVGTGPIAFGVFIAALPTGTAPTITSSPPSGLTGVGYSFTFTASGTAPITWSIVGGSLPPGLSLNTSTGVVSGTPTGAGSSTFTIRASNVAGQANLATAISITVPIVSVISLSSNDLNFGNQNVGSPSAAQIVTVTNTGNGPFDIRSVEGVGDFGFTANCSGTLVPSANCTVTVTFTPLTAGALAGRISVNSTAQQGDAGISLSGTGVAVPRANIIINPGSLSFGDQALGSSSAPQVIFVSNTGNATLALSSITLTGAGFNQTAPLPADNPRNHPACGSSLAPGLSCATGVVFAPAAELAASGNITIIHNATPNGGAGTSTINFTGNGTPRREAIIRVSAGLAFGELVVGTSSAPQTITVTNRGTIDLNVSGISVTPNDTNTSSADFQVGGSCATLIPNASCGLNVTFSPSAPLGGKSATLNIASNATNASASTASLLGTALPLPVPLVRLSATSIGFGTAIIGAAALTQSVTVTNAGVRTLIIGGVNTTGGFAQSNDCTRPLEPNQSCIVNLIFSATALNNSTGTLTINSNAPSTPDVVSLSGNGCLIANNRFFIARSCSQ